MNTDDWTQEEADAILQKCGAPVRWLQVVDGALVFQPDADGNYDVSLCIVKALKESGKTKIGFVGNQALRDSES